jgi:hypothetical protein
MPQLASEWNDLLNKTSNFSGKATFRIIMPLPNHSKNLIDGFINRKSAIKNTKLTLEALWYVIAPTSCKGVNTSLQMQIFCQTQEFKKYSLWRHLCNITHGQGSQRQKVLITVSK